MPFRTYDPYYSTPEKMETFRRVNADVRIADACVNSVNTFGHVVIGLPSSTSLSGLKVCIESAVDSYIDGNDAVTNGFYERCGIVQALAPSQLFVDYPHYRPASIPPEKSGAPHWAKGVYPLIKTNNVADYVGFSARPAPAFHYDGSLLDEMSISTLMIAPSNTMRARRLFAGVIVHFLGHIEQSASPEPN